MAMSILFVDDDKSLLEGIGRRLMLERPDIDYSLACSAEEALKKLETKKFDVIVSDHLMQGISGLTLLGIVRSKFPDVRRVMFSAQIYDNIFKEAEMLADIYIAKPCDTSEIIKKIEQLF